jgi:hypothetical protein
LKLFFNFHKAANFKLLETDEAVKNFSVACLLYYSLFPSQLRGVHSFLKGIPNKLLADVAFRCNAFDRALYYFGSPLFEPSLACLSYSPKESFLRLERKTSSESTTTAGLPLVSPAFVLS